MATKKTPSKEVLQLMDENAQLKAEIINLKAKLDGFIQIIADLKEAIQSLGKKYCGSPFKEISIQGRKYKLLDTNEGK